MQNRGVGGLLVGVGAVLIGLAFVEVKQPRVRGPNSAVLPMPPDFSVWFKEIERAHFQRDVERQSVIWDQNHVDAMLLICERVEGGLFTRGKGRYYCVRRGDVVFEWEFGKELFWSRMQNRLPERSARPEDKPASPWYPL